MARSDRLPYEANLDKLSRQVDHALKSARAKKRKTEGTVMQLKDKLEAAQLINTGSAVSLGVAIDEYQEFLNHMKKQHDLVVGFRNPPRDIVVRESGRVVRVLGEHDIVDDVMELIEQDIISHTLDSDEAVLAAASEWITRLTIGITNLTREKGDAR